MGATTAARRRPAARGRASRFAFGSGRRRRPAPTSRPAGAASADAAASGRRRPAPSPDRRRRRVAPPGASSTTSDTVAPGCARSCAKRAVVPRIRITGPGSHDPSEVPRIRSCVTYVRGSLPGAGRQTTVVSPARAQSALAVDDARPGLSLEDEELELRGAVEAQPERGAAAGPVDARRDRERPARRPRGRRAAGAGVDQREARRPSLRRRGARDRRQRRQHGDDHHRPHLVTDGTTSGRASSSPV